MDIIKNWVFSHLELILTLIGFVLTIVEIRRTKSAVVATKKATENTIQLLSDRSTISDVTSIRDSFREIQTSLRGKRFEAALIRIQELREKLYELRSREGFKSDERLQQIQEIVFGLKKMQDSIEAHISEPNKFTIPVPRYNSKLADFASQLSSWREEVHYMQRSTP